VSDARDADLLGRAASLQAEATDLLRRLEPETAFPAFGPAQVVGSAASGLMVWRDLDVVFTAPDATAASVLEGIARLAARCWLLAVEFRDERGERRPTERLADERHYAVCRCQGPGGLWKLDLTVWLHAVERPHRAEAERLRSALPGQRLAILRLKDLWRRGPYYPERIGGVDVYAAVLECGVRTPEEFSAYLRDRGLPDDPGVPNAVDDHA
jgi:hypothetical protein